MLIVSVFIAHTYVMAQCHVTTSQAILKRLNVYHQLMLHCVIREFSYLKNKEYLIQNIRVPIFVYNTLKW